MTECYHNDYSTLRQYLSSGSFLKTHISFIPNYSFTLLLYLCIYYCILGLFINFYITFLTSLLYCLRLSCLLNEYVVLCWHVLCCISVTYTCLLIAVCKVDISQNTESANNARIRIFRFSACELLHIFRIVQNVSKQAVAWLYVYCSVHPIFKTSLKHSKNIYGALKSWCRGFSWITQSQYTSGTDGTHFHLQWRDW